MTVNYILMNVGLSSSDVEVSVSKFLWKIISKISLPEMHLHKNNIWKTVTSWFARIWVFFFQNKTDGVQEFNMFAILTKKNCFKGRKHHERL